MEETEVLSGDQGNNEPGKFVLKRNLKRNHEEQTEQDDSDADLDSEIEVDDFQRSHQSSLLRNGVKKNEEGDSDEAVPEGESEINIFKRSDLGRIYQKRSKLSKKERKELETRVLGDGSAFLRSLPSPDDDSGIDVSQPEYQPAWKDDDDTDLVTVKDILHMRRAHKVPLGLKATSDYQNHLRKKFTEIYGDPSWAKLGKKHIEDEDPDLAILRSCGKMLEAPKYLTKGILDIKKMASLNCTTGNEGPVIKTVRFHPTTPVGLVAGLGCTASLLQVDGRGNTKLASVRFDKFPIRCARFSSSGNSFIIGSHMHSHFYSYDMLKGKSIRIPTHHNMGQTNMKRFEISPDGRYIAVAGRFGEIHLLTESSQEWISTMTMNGSVEALCFSPDGSRLYTTGDQGDVYVWDLNSRQLSHKFQDEGSIKGVSITASHCNTLLAVGSASGVVNLYETQSALKIKNPSPLKAIMNLVTTATSTCFNHSSQMLAISSDEKENSVKLVHLPSMTVFSNFPVMSSQFYRIQDVAFSPNSGYLSIANNKSTALLFRLKHFGNY